MAADTVEEIVRHIEAWRDKRIPMAREFSQDGLRKWTETMNYHTRLLVAAMDRKDPDFWTTLSELAVNAATLTTRGAKLRVNHQDRTDV